MRLFHVFYRGYVLRQESIKMLCTISYVVELSEGHMTRSVI